MPPKGPRSTLHPSDRGPGPAPPTFSVLIASHNQAAYVTDTLDSVAAQTFGEYEIVVVNDGSTDDTAAVVSAWAADFARTRPQRVTLDTIENRGQSAALEHGFGLTTGRYICLLDSDDRWLPSKLERVAEVAAAHAEAGMIVHPLLVVAPDGRRTGDVRPMRARLTHGDVRERMRRRPRHVAPATSGVVLRRDVFAALLPMPTRAFRADADYYLTFGACLLAPVHALEEPLGEYRMHPAGHYLWRATTPEGVRATVELQLVVARHFGLEAAMRGDSYFMRHLFALQLLEGRPHGKRVGLRALLGAILHDASYDLRAKLLMSAFWTVCAIAPRPVFERLWRRFELRHTGHDRLPPVSESA